MDAVMRIGLGGDWELQAFNFNLPVPYQIESDQIEFNSMVSSIRLCPGSHQLLLPAESGCIHGRLISNGPTAPTREVKVST